MLHELECVNCKKIFTRDRRSTDFSKKVFCSRKCTHQYMKGKYPKPELVKIKCQQCGKLFDTYPCRIKDGRKYCSNKCNWLSKIIPSNHVSLNCSVCGKEYQTTYHQMTKRNSKYCSRSCFHSGVRKIKSHRSFYWRKIAADVRERDNYKCRICGKEQGVKKLDVHHIIPAVNFLDDYESANSKKNLITLCRKCHRENEGKSPSFFVTYMKNDSDS